MNIKNEYQDVYLYKILRPIIKGLMYLIGPKSIVGCEYIPESGSIILAGNHTSIFDCLLLMSSTKRNIHFLAKSELFKGPKKLLFANMGLIPVNRKEKSKEPLIMAKKYLENDLVIGIFPEGTTEKGRGLMPFKMGTVKLASETNTLIVPFAIKGKYHLLSKTLKLKFGKPFKINGDNLEKENELLRNKIKKLLEDNDEYI